MNSKTINRYEKYLKSIKKMNSDTIVNYIYDLKAFSSFVDKDLFEVTEEDVDEFIKDKKKRGNGASRINFSISALSSFYKYAKRNGYMFSNPMKNIKRINIKIKKEEEKIHLSLYQIYETRRKLEEHGDIQLMVYFGLLISASPMKCVINDIRWRDINWKKKYIYARIDDKRSCILYLDDYTIEKLQDLRKLRKDKGIKRGQVFLTKYKGLNTITDETQSYWMNKIRQIIGLDKLTFGMIKLSNQHYLEVGRRFSKEKIELISQHRAFHIEFKELIFEERDKILEMK